MQNALNFLLNGWAGFPESQLNLDSVLAGWSKDGGFPWTVDTYDWGMGAFQAAGTIGS